jgi:multiple sugar transport system substrate-binding protein
MALRVALVGGPMYDGLYSLLPRDAEVVVHADHPTLNRAVAELLAAGERIDLLSTHSKYAPSQAQWLTPLDPELARDLAPRAVDLCTYGGALLCVPRNVDVRVMWARHDRLDDPPLTWEALLGADAVFGFTGRESGLFGTFFEHVASHGGALFDADHHPTIDTAHGVDAVEALCCLARRGPAALPSWHYDDVDAALGTGVVDMAATWPGGYGALRASPAARQLSPHPYLSGPAGLRSYSGSHAWAMPRTSGDPPAALDAIRLLSSFEAHALDAASGTVCAHVDAFASVAPLDAVDAARLDIIRATIADGMITYPPLPRFPLIEDAGWSSINAALRGALSPRDAVARMQRAAEATLHAD